MHEEKWRFYSGTTALSTGILGGVSAITGIAKNIKDMATNKKETV